MKEEAFAEHKIYSTNEIDKDINIDHILREFYQNTEKYNYSHYINKRWENIRLTLDKKYHKLRCPLQFAKQTIIKDMNHFDELYNNIIENGGEGIMIKHPESEYENKRSDMLLKYKPSFDEEAIVIDYKEGKGKYKGLLGGFVCRPLINMNNYHIIDNNENHEFTISGMDDEVRKDYELTHPIGTIISLEHSGKTKLGKPRFARYIRKRDDILVENKIEEPSLEKRICHSLLERHLKEAALVKSQ